MSEAKEAVKPNGTPPSEMPIPKTLVQKLCEVMAAVGYTQKTGWNEAQKYHYVTEADIAEKIRPELAKRNVIIFPTLVSSTRTKIERNYFDKFDKCVKTKESWAVDVLMRWTVVDGDNGEQFICEIPGCSESPGDKGVYVAITGSEKYLLMKLFLLPTGDDPEDDSNEPPGSKEAAKAVGEAKVAKLKEKVKAPDRLFYTLPESHNGFSAELINVKAFGESLNEVAAEGLRAILKKYVRTNKAGELLVSTGEKLEALTAELASVGVPLEELKAARS